MAAAIIKSRTRESADKKSFKPSDDYVINMRRIHLENNIIYPAISTFAVQICYTNKFLLYSY